MRCSYLIVLVALFVSFLPHNTLGQVSTIESQGVAAIVQGNLDISRDKAVEDALRNAVEQATGSLIENETLVENYQLLSDKIYSQSRGYVQSYEVLDEKAEAGLYRVTIQANVASGELKNDLRALNILMRQVRKPRVMVLFEETQQFGHKNIYFEPDLSNIPARIAEIAEPEDLIFVLGAGSINTIIPELIKELKEK